jgi:very-short-patch-repair endonuclease
MSIVVDENTTDPHPRAARDPSPATPTTTPPPGRGVKLRRRPPSQARTRLPAVKQAARKLREESTPSERMLWEALRGARLRGLKFRRQHPIDRFVLDFYCPESRLAVETDGAVHDKLHTADEERQTILESMGIRFVRLPASLVEDDFDPALDRIERAAFSHPSPHFTGEGSPEGRR